MQLKFWRHELQLAHTWAVAGTGGTNFCEVVLLELTGPDGVVGRGEASPSRRYGETTDSATAFLRSVDAGRLSFDDLDKSMDYLATIAPGEFAARGAVNVALLDGAAKKAGQPLSEFLGLGFREKHHVTSFTIGIDTPEVVREKVLAAGPYPVLKMKVGVANDRENLKALREIAPTKWVRVDANEGWQTREQALEMIEWLAEDTYIQFVEQPMPADSNPKDLIWLKHRSPLPIFADESYHTAKDAPRCADGFHGVNVKLCKTGGVNAAAEALRAAREAGLKTMIGCMIETSVLISAATHLAGLCDYLDLDGNLLITNDPFLGVTAEKGILSFTSAPEQLGLRVRARKP